MPIAYDKKQAGFTLIELLLVIVILSTMAALGIVVYRREFISNRLDTVSIAMQHVFEAAIAYYGDTHTWPKAHVCGSNEPDFDNFVMHYLPNASYKNHFGSDFCWSAAATDPDNPKEVSHLFWVAVSVPALGKSAALLAQRLAARLPNAITTRDPMQSDPVPCDSDTCFVRAEVTAPGFASSAPSAPALLASGVCRSDVTQQSGTSQCQDISQGSMQAYQVTFKACPLGSTPVMSVAPNFVALPLIRNPYTLVGFEAYAHNCTSQPDASGNEQCDITVPVAICEPNGRNNCKSRDIHTLGGHAGASYFVFCKETTVGVSV